MLYINYSIYSNKLNYTFIAFYLIAMKWMTFYNTALLHNKSFYQSFSTLKYIIFSYWVAFCRIIWNGWKHLSLSEIKVANIQLIHPSSCLLHHRSFNNLYSETYIHSWYGIALNESKIYITHKPYSQLNDNSFCIHSEKI